ncbi:PilC/PilY family type IV pilus protein [Halopseudomonas salegens]|uniref:Type IV pilus assembly protein PilY1 n=1 Tax=Halopseudomonas salegens TaxID=1434072 RepID=A0A1H2GLP5_9GAMM|nr:PilC/PilY family type IV pilus protein [Halopseudomonas salegens]SDU20432.1 type IV pilus assembly protein PilY1 [Halopseudomonas salegens]
MCKVKPESGAVRYRRLLAICAGAGMSLAGAQSVPAFAPLSGPILASPAVAPNVVILFDNSSSMRTGIGDNGRGIERLQVARRAVKSLLSDNRDMRFGLFVFNESTGVGTRRDTHGGRLLVPVDAINETTSAGQAHKQRLIDQIDAISPVPADVGNADGWTHTPLAETYYEVTRYMRGLEPYFSPAPAAASPDQGNRAAFQSPIQYRCQGNFGLIITDGLPTYDSQFPTSSTVEPDAGVLAAGETVADKLRSWHDPFLGNLDSIDIAEEGSTFFLNDIARFAHDIDMRTAERDGTDNAGQSWDDPAFAQQNMRTHTIGFTVDDPRLSSMANAGNGRYYPANDSAQFSYALGSALRGINAAAGSGGGGAVSGPDLQADSVFYRTRYDPQDWSGRIDAVAIDGNGQPGELRWSTDNTFKRATRGRYQTYRMPGGTGAVGIAELDSGTFATLAREQQSLLQTEASIAGIADQPAAGQHLLDWARGNQINGLRPRGHLLGDIIHSNLAFARPGERTAVPSTAYNAFVASKLAEMTPSLVAGSNDGLLHVFSADAGKHRLAYLPVATYTTLGGRARTDFTAATHLSGVDGKIAVADAQLGTSNVWTTLAVGGLGAGGQGLYAIRLFDAVQGNSALGALWEIGPHTSSDWQHMGYTYAQPQIARLNGQWVAITGNGYGSTSGHAVLYVINLQNGARVAEITVDTRGGNGLSTPVLVTDSQGDVIGAYAGDLAGNLWKFDLGGSSSASWGNALGSSPLFTTDTGQPITVAPQWVNHPDSGRLVLFGTGKFLEFADRTELTEQAFYAVWDRPGDQGGLTSDNLLEQNISAEYQQDAFDLNGDNISVPVREVSQRAVDWSHERGWKLPLIHEGNAVGERVTQPFLVRSKRVVFTSGFIRNDGADPCISEGDGWLMALNIFSGAMMAYPILDTNQDGRVDSYDVVVAGVGPGVGLPGEITGVRGEGVEHYIIQGSAGSGGVAGLLLDTFRRIMWRQLM